MAINQQDLLDAGVHFGHLTRKWNPKMAPYIFMEQNGIHIIDLKKTEAKLEEACNAVRNIVKSGRKVLFVATKKQAKEIIAEIATDAQQPFVTERWLGGMLTNFATVRKSIKRMQNISKMMTDGTFENINKKERLMLTREKAKLERMLGGIEDLSKLPGALFITDIRREHIAVSEARRLGIPTFAIVDTNSDPTQVDFPIPANDDASKSIFVIARAIADAIQEAQQERRREKDETPAEEPAATEEA
jgi:small subunit ribosomal protein S2